MDSSTPYFSLCVIWWHVHCLVILQFHGSRLCLCRPWGQNHSFWRSLLLGSFFVPLWWLEIYLFDIFQYRLIRLLGPPPHFSLQCLHIWWHLEGKVGLLMFLSFLLLLVVSLLVGWELLSSFLYFCCSGAWSLGMDPKDPYSRSQQAWDWGLVVFVVVYFCFLLIQLVLLLIIF